MRNTVLLYVMLSMLLQACAASLPPSPKPSPKPSLPEAVINPPSASEPLHLLEKLQGIWSDSLEDLLTSLKRAKLSPPPTAPAESGR